jgi:hypothetical protein
MMELILERLLAEMNVMHERTNANLQKMEANIKEFKTKIKTNREEMRTNQEEMTARLEALIVANNENFEVLRSALVSRMDIHQTRTESTQKEMKVKIDIHQEKMESTVHSIRSELEETIKHRVEDVLSCVDQNTQDLRKELNEKTDKTKVELQAIRLSVNTRTKCLLKTIIGARKHFHGEFGLMIQGETQMTKTLMDTTSRGLEAKIVEVDAGAEGGNGSGTGAGAAKPPTFDRTTTRACFGAIETVTDDNCWTRRDKSMCSITALQDLPTDMLHGAPKEATY